MPWGSASMSNWSIIALFWIMCVKAVTCTNVLFTPKLFFWIEGSTFLTFYRAVRVPRFSWFLVFKFSGGKMSAFSFDFSPYLAFYADFMLFFALAPHAPGFNKYLQATFIFFIYFFLYEVKKIHSFPFILEPICIDYISSQSQEPKYIFIVLA